MSAEDLAIDVGIPINTDEFDTFVACVENILEHGCGYSSEVTSHILERCETSELAIAKEVLRECRRENKSRIRPSKLKWWQTWRSAREGNDTPRWPVSKIDKRPMSPMFNKQKKRPMSPMFNKQKKRPMSPMFNKQKKRPMSPMFNKQKKRGRYAEARSPEYERHTYGRRDDKQRSHKRQRYR